MIESRWYAFTEFFGGDYYIIRLTEEDDFVREEIERCIIEQVYYNDKGIKNEIM